MRWLPILLWALASFLLLMTVTANQNYRQASWAREKKQHATARAFSLILAVWTFAIGVWLWVR